MIKIRRTVVLDGSTKEDYDKIVAHLEETTPVNQGWDIHKEPLLNKVTATKYEEIQEI